MTNESKRQMNDIMKQLVRSQIGCFTHEQNGWSEYVDTCISAEICPKCGNDLFVDEGFFDHGLREITFSECPACEWKNLNHTETPPLMA